MQLTERDLTLVAHVARHRFLTSAQLAALDGGSPQNVLRALRALFDHEYLDRPMAQIASMVAGGSQPLVYGLGRKGARALREHSHHLKSGGDWTEKNKRAGAVFIEHTLEVAGFMAALELSCRGRSDMSLIREEEIIAQAPEETQRSREPLRWKVERVERGRKEISSVVPDGMFGLRFADETASYFLLEIDRGTIPLRRSDTLGSAAWRKNIAFKLDTYYRGWRAERHVAQLGLKQMRVLMVTSSAERMDHMLSVLDEVTEGRGSAFFLFADRRRLEGRSPLEVEWINGKRVTVGLAD